MKSRFYFVTVIIIFTLFPGCHNDVISDHKIDIKLGESLMDSIHRLDSIITRTRVSNNGLAVFYAKRCICLAQNVNIPEALIMAFNAMGNAYNGNVKDSCYYYYTKANRLADSCNIVTLKPQICLNLAMIYVNASNIKMGISLVDSSIILAEKYHQPEVLADAYNALGLIKLSSYDSLGGKQSFERAFEIGKKNHLQRQCGNAQGNLALYETNPEVSAQLLHKAMQFYQGLSGLEEEKALCNINLGYMQKVTDSAIRYYRRALEIAEPRGLNGAVISAYNNLAYAYLDKKDVKMAESCLETAIPVALKQADADWLATLYDTYADVLMEKGEVGKALTYQKKAYKSRSIAGSDKSSGQIKLLSAMLDLHTKDAQIRQKDDDLQIKTIENRILKFVVALFALTVTALLFFLLWYRQRARLIRIQEQMSAASRIIELEEMEKHRLGFELHDHVGYLVRGISQFVQEYTFSDQSEKNRILEKISELRLSIRRLSHRLNPINVQNEKFPDLLSDLIKDFSALSGISVKYFIPEYFPDLSQIHLLHMIRIVQELLTNASKHASGCHVKLNISVTDATLLMIYQDDGPGFETPDNKGFGFQSIEERIRLMEGKCLLETRPGSGTKWEFLIPLHKPTSQNVANPIILH